MPAKLKKIFSFRLTDCYLICLFKVAKMKAVELEASHQNMQEADNEQPPAKMRRADIEVNFS